MEYEVAWVLIAIFFWVLCAVAVVAGVAWVFCYCNYFRWDREDRIKDEVLRQANGAMVEKVDTIDLKSIE